MGSRKGGRGLVRVAALGVAALLTGACDGSSTSSTPHGAGAGGTGASSASGGSSDTGGSSNTGGSGGGSAEVGDFEAFLVNVGRKYCARLFRCVESDDDFFQAQLVLKTVAGCEAELASVYATSANTRDQRARLAASSLAFNATAAAQCLDELAVCNGIDSLTQGSCREVLEGTLQPGAACYRSDDCAGDAYCARDVACPGQCQARKTAGEACSRSDECTDMASGYTFCPSGDTGTTVCKTLPIAPKAALAQPCTRELTGAEALVLCEDGMWCAQVEGASDEEPMGRCALPLPPEAPCSDSDDVCTGGWCDLDAGSCRAVTLRSKVGESCVGDELICDPTLGLRCSDQGLCEGSGDGKAGSPCFGGDFQRPCQAGLYCKPSEGSAAGACTPLLPIGSACEFGTACETGTCNTTCAARYCAY